MTTSSVASLIVPAFVLLSSSVLASHAATYDTEKGSGHRSYRHGTDLDAALLSDVLPPISTKCIESGRHSSGHGSFSFVHTPPPSPSYDDGDDDGDGSDRTTFSSNALKHDRQLFQASITHTNPNFNRTWSLRIGTGGNIYSFLGPWGDYHQDGTTPKQVQVQEAAEAIPPQMWQFSPFVDEVIQVVPTDLSRNVPDKDDDGIHSHWFVHQVRACMYAAAK